MTLQIRPDVASLKYSDGIAASRTMLALTANRGALERRLPDEWELAPYAGDDLRGKSLREANVLVPFHEVYGVRTRDGHANGMSQMSYVVFISQARHRTTGALTHIHWFTYTEDPSAVPGKYRDAALAQITRSQTFSKVNRGETRVREFVRAHGQNGLIELSLEYVQGGQLVWATADQPNLELRGANDMNVIRWYREDQVMDVVRSDPLGVNRVSEIALRVEGELSDVFDGNERVVAVVIQRPYMRQVYVP